MPSTDAVSMDGEYRLSRSLKSEEFTEQRRLKPHSIQPEQASTFTDSYATEYSRSDSDDDFRYQSAVDTTADHYRRSPQPTSEGRDVYSPPRSFHNSYTQVNVAAVNYENNSVLDSVNAHAALAGENAFGHKLRAQIQNFLNDQVTPIRLASHLAVLAVAAVVLIVSRAELPNWQFSLRTLPDNSLFGTQGAVSGTGNHVADATDTFQRAVVPFTESQQEVVVAPVAEVVVSQPVQLAAQSSRLEIDTYSVKSGDTVLAIAARYNIKPETIQWANPELEANPDKLRIGDRLVILPVDGVLHVVQTGETLSTIAARYKVTLQSIVDYPLNALPSTDASIPVGSQLVIPEGTKPYITRQVAAYSGPIPQSAAKGSGSLGWPAAGSVSQPFWTGHRAIDIAARTGTSVTAADGGYVIAASAGGWNSGYGNNVMIDHGNGYVTLYAHLNSIFVRQGESVSKGQQIGTVGNTGNSTGSHLHFEVRYQGAARNPFSYLP